MLNTIPSSWKAAGILVIVLSLWMISGLFASDDAENDTDSSTSIQPMAVEVRVSESVKMSRTLDLQGQIDPSRQVLVKAQTSGEVEQIIARKGMLVGSGDALVKLKEAGRANELAEVTASVKSARSEQQAALSLRRQRLQSQLQLEQANAVLEAALARLASVNLDIGNTTIKAPFPGVINALPVELGALIEHGDLIAELVDNSAFKVSARVSQQNLSQLSIGKPVNVSLITGQILSGKLSFIGSVADPQTRSFLVEAQVDNASNAVAAGISATMSIPVEEVEATFITSALLSLRDDGALGVKALDDNDTVVFYPIELVSTEIDGAWVTGVPANTRIITLGQGFVNTGEKVRAQLAGTS